MPRPLLFVVAVVAAVATAGCAAAAYKRPVATDSAPSSLLAQRGALGEGGRGR